MIKAIGLECLKAPPIEERKPHKYGVRYTIKQKRKFLDLIDKGMSVVKASEKVGISISCGYNVKRTRLVEAKNKLPEDKLKGILSMLNQGVSGYEIARKLHVSRSTVKKVRDGYYSRSRKNK